MSFFPRLQVSWKRQANRSLMLLFCLFVGGATACGPSATKECDFDDDCAGTRLCFEGRCRLIHSENEKNNSHLERFVTPDAASLRDELPPPDPNEPPNPPDIKTSELPPDNGTPDNGTPTDVGTPDHGGTDNDKGACKDGESKRCYEGPSGTQGVGRCAAGKLLCRNGEWETFCSGQLLPEKETCNGIDDDCDGKTDNNANGVGDACQVPGGRGPCAQGKQVCENETILCKPTYTPKTEVCGNGQDDDCNGLSDEPPCACKPGESRECYDGPAGTAGQGGCKKGTQQCDSNGRWQTCDGALLPKPEICNGKDDNCNGLTDENFPEKGRSCSDTTKKGECQKGTYSQCVGGQLKCRSNVLSRTEICGNGKDDDCDGSTDENPPCQCKAGQKTSCYSGPPGTDGRGPCKRGEQTCQRDGTWGSCVGAVIPKTEVCNGKDDDCNGSTDENFPDRNRPCTGAGQGVCRVGSWQCVSGSKKCVSTVTPSSEVCDQKDNNCNGQVDEGGICSSCRTGQTRACYTGPTGTRGRGECKEGSQTCSNGRWGPCSGQKTPAPEICRDNKDNDCDGRVDESCGYLYSFAQIDSNGTLRHQRGFTSSSKVSTGTYLLTTSSSTMACGDRVILMTPQTSSQRPMGYTCDNGKYKIYIGSPGTTSSFNLSDRRFSVGIPAKTTGDVWGEVAVIPFLGTPFISPTARHGNPSIKRVSRGVFDVTASACNTARSAILVSVYGTGMGYGTGDFHQGKCRIQIYNLKGDLSDRSFSFWIPSPTTASWATIDSAGKVTAFNNHGDSSVKWTSKHNSGTYRYTDITPYGMTSKSAILLTPRIGSGFHAPVLGWGTRFSSYTRRVSDGAQLPSGISALVIH